MRAPRPRRTRFPLDPPWIAVLAIAAALRLAAILLVGDMPALHGDEGYYVESARVLASGHDLADTFRPPGYPLFLAAVFRAAGDHLLALRLAQLVAGLILVALVYDLVRGRFGERAAALSALVCALHPTLIQYTHFLWSESIFATGVVLSLWCFDRFDRDPEHPAGWLAAAGGALAATCLTRELLLYLVPVALVWVWAIGPASLTIRLRRAALLLAPIALVIVGWEARNHSIHGRFTPLATNGWFATALGNFLPPDRILGPSPELRGFQEAYRAIDGELARQEFARRTALQSIAQAQPGWIVKKTLRNGFYLFAPRSQLGRFLQNGWLAPGTEPIARGMVAAERVYYPLATGLGIAALWLVPGGRTKVLVVAVIALHLGVYIAANSTHRFRVPLLPLFALYAGPLLCGAIARGRSLYWRVAGAAVCLAAFAAVLLTPDPPRPGDASGGGDEAAWRAPARG